jgi:RNA polymerase sigma-70 factor (ECF subfamily)
MSRRKGLEFSDQELANEVRSGSGVAFERLMRRYERLVFKVAFGFTGDGESAMDVTQNTFLKVHERLGSWRGEGDLRNWIARIAANEAMNWTRARRRRPTSEFDEDVFLQPDPPQERAFRHREQRETLHRSLSSLNPRQRLAVVLRYFQGMTTREISSVLECSEGTARNILFRSLRKLRTVLAESREILQ